MDWWFFLEVFVGGLLSGVMYSLVALGFVLIFKKLESSFTSSGLRNSLDIPPDLKEQCFDIGSLNLSIIFYS